jgi:2-polyprenyl-6-methoxyphenol hydroxylase-like FAD-dependent oxidoreductase
MVQSHSYLYFLHSLQLTFLQMYGNYASIVWSLHTPRAKAMLALPDDVLIKHIREAFVNPISPHVPLVHDMARYFGFVFNVFIHFLFSFNALDKHYVPSDFPEIKQIVGPKNAFPLKYAHASSYCKSRLALIGYIFSLFTNLIFSETQHIPFIL